MALLILAVILTASVYTMNTMFKAQQFDAKVINQAGRQRMLSQRIALSVNLLVQKIRNQDPKQDTIRSMLLESANLMLSSHNGLMNTAPSDEIQKLYRSGDPSLDQDVKQYVKSALNILDATRTEHINPDDLLQFETHNINYLLFRLNIVVNAYEEDAEQRLSNNITAQTVLWLITLTLLVLEYLLIFRPTIRLIRKSFEQQTLKENRIQLAANSASLGIWEYDIRDESLLWDDQMWRIFYESGPKSHIANYELFDQRVHPEDKERVSENFQYAIAHQTNMDFTFRIITPSKELRYIHVYSIVEYDHRGNAIRIVGTNKDITEQKHKEDSLIEAKHKAEVATRIKGEFLASMSHEIRTPLNGVMGMLNLLKNTPLTPVQSQRVTIALSSARTLLALINDILDFSKIEADKLQIETIDFDLNKLLIELVESLAPLAENNNIELILDTIQVEHKRVLGDPGRIRQLLTNLLSNAIKFTKEGHVILTVSLMQYSEETWQLQFSVEDTGIGIPEDKIDGLFDAFSQVDSSTTRLYGGTGLGLAIVKRLCIAMGGGIHVSSQLNRGSRFYGSLLLGKSANSEILAPDFDVSQLNILIVDDNSVNLNILSEQLKHWGINVTSANSGQQAINICEQRFQANQALFDIAILDMQMPSMDGAELGKILKDDTRFTNMNLVMMTSMSMENDSQFMADIGFCAYFAKPVTTSDLFLALSVIGDNGEALRKATPLLTHDYLNSLNANELQSEVDIKEQVAKLHNPHILLVEDNSINQMVAIDLLEDIGFIVTCANDGIDALNILKDRPHDPFTLILMDCQMPQMDGFETTRQIRAGTSGIIHADTPIIALTANNMEGDQQKCLDAGMNGFISKPIERALLERIIVSWLMPA